MDVRVFSASRNKDSTGYELRALCQAHMTRFETDTVLGPEKAWASAEQLKRFEEKA